MKVARKNLYIRSILVLIIGSSIFACSQPITVEEPKTIGQVDFNNYQEDFLSAQTQEQVQRLDSFIFDVIKDSSVNRLLPDVWTTDQYGTPVNMSLLVDRPTLIVITSPYARWNSVELARDLPDAVAGFGEDKKVICLLLEEPIPAGQEVPPDFYKVQMEQLASLFPRTLLINSKEAQKLNVFALPSRYYFNAEAKLVQVNKGAIPKNRLIKEVKEFEQSLGS